MSAFSASSDTHAPVVLLIIDMINDMEFEGGEDLFEYALPAAHRIAELKHRARAAQIPVIYANDNFGHWRSDFRAVVEHCLTEGVRGRPIAELLTPDEDDYFVLKPRHSAFYNSTLDTLLHCFNARTLILTGVSGDICLLFTAIDAYMRDLKLLVPADCTASESPEENDRVLAYMQRVLDADLRPTDELDLEAVLGSEALNG